MQAEVNEVDVGRVPKQVQPLLWLWRTVDISIGIAKTLINVSIGNK